MGLNWGVHLSKLGRLATLTQFGLFCKKTWVSDNCTQIKHVCKVHNSMCRALHALSWFNHTHVHVLIQGASHVWLYMFMHSKLHI